MSGFKLYGKFTWSESDKAAYVDALRALKLATPNLYIQLAPLLNTRRRGYFAKSRLALFPQSPHLADKNANATLLEPGWYANTNISNEEKEKVIIKACHLSGINYIYDLELHFENGSYHPCSKEQAIAELESIFSHFSKVMSDDHQLTK